MSATSTLFERTYLAAATAFEATGSKQIDQAATIRYAQFCDSQDYGGVVIAPGHGEAQHLTFAERRMLLQLWKGNSDLDRILNITPSHAGEEPEAMAAFARDNQDDVSAFLVQPPTTSAGNTTEGTRVWYRELFDRFRELEVEKKILLYDLPQVRHWPLGSQLAGELAHENPELVIGAKYSGTSLSEVEKYLKMTPDGFSLFLGSGGFVVNGRKLGTYGSINGDMNICGSRFVELHRAVDRGEWESADRHQDAINRYWAWCLSDDRVHPIYLHKLFLDLIVPGGFPTVMRMQVPVAETDLASRLLALTQSGFEHSPE